MVLKFPNYLLCQFKDLQNSYDSKTFHFCIFSVLFMTSKKRKQKKESFVKERSTSFQSDKTSVIKFRELLNDDRTLKVIGVILLLVSVYLFLAFTSYLFTWKDDQSQIFNLSYRILLDNNSKVQNILGRLGAYISHLFFFKGTGFASYLICYLLFAFGVNLVVDKKVFRLWRTLRYVIFGLLFFSIFLSFVFHFVIYSQFPAGGALGNMVSSYLIRLIGELGVILLLIVVLLIFLILKFNFDFKVFPFRSQSSSDAIVGSVSFKTESDKDKSGIGSNDFSNERKISEHLHSSTGIQELDPNEFQFNPKDGQISKLIPKSINLVNPLNLIVTDKLSDSNLNKLDFEINTPLLTPKDLNLTFLPVSQKPDSRQTPYEPSLDLRDYQFPSLDLLEKYDNETIIHDTEELKKNKDQILNTLRNYDIEIQKITATVGPTVTLYEIVPAAGIRISRIKNLEDDIALNLSALGIRIIAPIPGKGTIGIEVPNERKTIVSMRTLLASEKFLHNSTSLPIAIGKRIDNENFIVDLTSMPHLLMAGATGQGKSVGINAVLVSLLFKKHPSQLKLILIDPKKVELSLYKVIEKHFLAKLPNDEDSIITDTKKVIYTLNALCIEMDLRYDLLKEAGTRNIREYNDKFVHRKLNPEKGHRFLPFIVLVIDEFADLIMTAGKEIEMPLARLAQLARAVGIHLILATQRPSVNIITGTIKANFPARIAFKVSSKVDSRTILDIGGAEQLVGKGDMLISYNGELVRLQCAFVDTQEVENVVNFIGNQIGYQEAYLLPEYEDDREQDGRVGNSGEKDPLFEEAAKIIVGSQTGSTSLLQRRMKLGYNRAGRLMDQLELAGIVGPNVGSKVREVLIKTDYELERHLNNLTL